MDDSGGRTRAAALPAEQRRERIIEATMPLLVEHGVELTTRQIAEAAGVAEGTIFRVFPDKDSVIEAVITAAFDPAPFEAALARIDRSLPFEGRLVVAVELLQARMAEIGQLMTAAGLSRPPSGSEHGRPLPTSIDALATFFEADAGRLRRSPHDCATLLRGLTFAGTHPSFAVDGPLPPEEIVALLLDGVRSC